MTPSYEAHPTATTRDAFVTQINAQAGRGFRFFSGIGFTNGASVETVEAFVKDVDTIYTFEALSETASVADMQAQLNAQGARGFRWAGPYGVDGQVLALFRKDMNATTTYSYTLETAAESSAASLAQVNSFGAAGYYNLGSTYAIGGSTVRIFEKATTASTYLTELLARPANASEFMAQLNAQGARGFRFKSEFVFSDGRLVIYEKDASQSAAFTFSALDPSSTSAALITQANAEGQQGRALVGDYVLPDGSMKTLYVAPTNCSGFLCQTRNLFGF